MKTKTSELIEKTLREELNQQIPTQPSQGENIQPQLNTQQSQPQTEQSQEEQPKIEVYIPLHSGNFTNRIFTTNKNVVIKVLDDSINSDIDTIMELENNKSMYHEISI